MATTFDPIEVGARIRLLRRNRGFTNGSLFAKHAGVSTGLLNDVERGQIGDRVAITSLDKIALGLKMPLVSLLAGDEPPETFEPVNPKSMRGTLQQLVKGQQRIIDLLEPKPARSPARPGLSVIEPPERQGLVRVAVRQEIAAGGGSPSAPMTEDSEWIAVDKKFKTYGADLVAHRVRGDSMEPRLHDGNIILVNYPRQNQPAMSLLEHGRMYVLVTRGSGDEYDNLVKYFVLDHESGRDMLLSMNPEHGHEPLPKPDDIVFIGEVVEVIE